MDTPYQWTKQVASHWGGTRNGTIVHWPNGIKAKGEIRIAVLPRDRRRADDPRGGRACPQPTIVNSIQQAPIEGVSMLYAFNDAKAAERHETQYFEMFCNRGIYHKGWTAVTRHGVPWVGAYKRAFDDDVWELYDTNTDWTQSKDLAKENPKKLAELQRLFLIEATKYSVLPLDDRTFERFNPDLAGRPQLIKGNSQILFGGMGRLSENSVVVTQEQVVFDHRRDRGAEIRRRRRHRRAGRQRRRLEPLRQGRQAEALLQLLRHRAVLRRGRRSRFPAGKHQVRMEFKYDGGGLAKGGTVSLFVDGKKDGEGRVEHDRADGLLRRRDLRRRQGNRLAGLAGLRPDGQRVQRRGQLGADRPGEGRSRSPDLAGGALPGRDGAAVD